MTPSPEALAAAKECASHFSASEVTMIIDIINRNVAPLRAERDALQLRVTKALELLEFHEHSAEIEHPENPHCQPTIRMNAEDFNAALKALREAAQVQQ